MHRKFSASLVVAALLLMPGVRAQSVQPDESNLPPKTFATAADVQKLIETAAARHREGTLTSEYIAALAPYHVNLEYRTTPTAPAVHLKEAELIYVMQGSGTLIVGGTMENAKPTKPGNLGGTAVSGGTSEPLAPGNFALVPEGVPHWFSAVTQGPLVTMSFHVPRPVSAAQ